jgi:hypothetical protein
MAPDFAPTPDGDDYRADDDDIFYDDPSEAAAFSDFRQALEYVDLVRLPASYELKNLLSESIGTAAAALFHDFDEGLYQGGTPKHQSLQAIDNCFVSTRPADVREVFRAVRVIIDEAVEKRRVDCGESELDTAAAEAMYDQLLRSGCESLVRTTIDSIFQCYEERLDRQFIALFEEDINVQIKRLELLGIDPDFKPTARYEQALSLYQEKFDQAQNISQKVLSEEYLMMEEAYPSFIERAVSELHDLAPELMQILSDEETSGVDPLTSFESEWCERHTSPFQERLATSLATARGRLESALKKLHDKLPRPPKRRK